MNFRPDEFTITLAAVEAYPISGTDAIRVTFLPPEDPRNHKFAFTVTWYQSSTRFLRVDNKWYFFPQPNYHGCWDRYRLNEGVADTIRNEFITAAELAIKKQMETA